MTTYRVTYADAKGGSEISTFVDADVMERDPHWVTFYTEESRPDVLDSGCECGGQTRVRRIVSGKRKMVALFPYGRVREVRVAERTGD